MAFRTFVNKAGIVYNALKTAIIYAEDLNEIQSRILSLEGLSPGGGWTVGDTVESVDGSRLDFTVSHDPVLVVIDGNTRRSTKGYTYSAGVISVDPLIPPQFDIYYFY